VSEPAQQPPQPGRESARALVVGDHLHALIDAEASEGGGEHFDLR